VIDQTCDNSGTEALQNALYVISLKWQKKVWSDKGEHHVVKLKEDAAKIRL
jgi:hypothetical protein